MSSSGAGSGVGSPVKSADAGAVESKSGGADARPMPPRAPGWFIGEVRAAVGKRNMMARTKPENGKKSVFGDIVAYDLESDTVTIQTLRTKEKHLVPRDKLAVPTRLVRGQKVRTNYGRGRVVSTRFNDEEAVVTVELIDWSLANDTRPIVHCVPGECQLRAPTGRELVEEVTALKSDGTAFIKAGKYEDASRAFVRVVNRLKHVTLTSSNVSAEDKVSLQKVFVSCCTNLLLAQEKAGNTDNSQVISYCTKAIEFDPDNNSGLVWKCLLRRADAYMTRKNYADAMADYRHKYLTNEPYTKRAKAGLKRAKSLKKKRDEKHRARMEKASKKFLEDGVDTPTSTATDDSSVGGDMEVAASAPGDSEDPKDLTEDDEAVGDDGSELESGWSWKRTLGMAAVVGAAALGAYWWRRNLRRR